MTANSHISTKYHSIRIGDHLVELQKPLVMGILNVTPDSFYDGGMYQTRDMIRMRAQRMVDEGADLLDIGACSTRPGSQEPEEEQEQARLEMALTAIRENLPDTILSVDTFRSGIARWAVHDFGVQIINDISGGSRDPEMFTTVGQLGVPYVLMHMQGTPETMQLDPRYGDVIGDISHFFADRILSLTRAGVADIILDPGFGFGKTLSHNYELLSKLEEFALFNRPLLVGISRKSMIYKALNGAPESSLNGTTALHALALLKGAGILRVHDVKQAVECVNLLSRINY